MRPMYSEYATRTSKMNVVRTRRCIVVPMRVVIDANVVLYDEKGRQYTVRSVRAFNVPEPCVIFRRVSGSEKKSTCAYCGKHGKLTRDHILPKSLGYDFAGNLAKVCTSCNSRKGNRTLGQWLAAEMYAADFGQLYTNVSAFMRSYVCQCRYEVSVDWNCFLKFMYLQ